MNKTILTGLAGAMMLSVLLVPTNAYHVDGTQAADTQSTYVWTNPENIGFNNTTILGLILCEDKNGGLVTLFPGGDPVGPIDVETGESRNGNGGLCYMSPGNNATNGGNANDDIRSNGTDPCGDAAGPKFYSELSGSAAACADNWVELDMCQYQPVDMGDGNTGPKCVDNDHHVAWEAQIDIYSCYVRQGVGPKGGGVGDSFYYYELFALYLDNGHVAGFVDFTTPGSVIPDANGVFGSYGVDDTGVPSAPHTHDEVSCDEPAPMYVEDESGIFV